MQTIGAQPHLYPLEPWRITEQAFDSASNLLDETLFALGNGYIGLRGAHEEEYGGPPGTSLDGTYLNGFYESKPFHYPETAYALARNSQFMLNVPNAKRIDLFVEDERFNLFQGTVARYERWLDLQSGVLTRVVEWESVAGHRVAVTSRRLVSFTHKHLFAIQYDVQLLNFSGHIRLVSGVDGEVQNLEAGDDPRVGSAVSGSVLDLLDVAQAADFCSLMHRTHHSGLVLVSAIEHEVVRSGEGTITSEIGMIGQRVEQRYGVQAQEGERVSLTKFGAYVSSRDYPESELPARAREVIIRPGPRGLTRCSWPRSSFLPRSGTRPAWK